MNISDLRVIVTGAASGLGKCFALSLLQDGARVAAMDVNQEGLQSLETEAGQHADRLSCHQANVADEAEVVALVKKVADDFGSVNGLINNAGIFRDGFLVRPDRKSGDLKVMSLENWQSVIDIDLTGPFLMTREVVAQMLRRDVKPGIVINISSISRHGNMGQSNYSAAKAGLVADTKLWSHELAAHEIRVVAIAPGFVRTPILEAMRPGILQMMTDEVPIKRMAEPHEIYQGVRFAIECDYFNGKCLDIDGGLSI